MRDCGVVVVLVRVVRVVVLMLVRMTSAVGCCCAVVYRSRLDMLHCGVLVDCRSCVSFWRVAVDVAACVLLALDGRRRWCRS